MRVVRDADNGIELVGYIRKEPDRQNRRFEILIPKERTRAGILIPFPWLKLHSRYGLQGRSPAQKADLCPEALTRPSRSVATTSYRQLHGWILLPLVICAVGTHVESRKGAGPGPTGSRWFPFPAHQTGRVHFEHPAFRLVSPQAHGSRPRCTSRNRSTPSFPNTTASENVVKPLEDTLWRRRRNDRTRS